MDREAAFEQLYDEYRDRIYRMCCYYAAGEGDRKDLYQEVMANIWKGLGGFRGDSALSTWIYRVTVNSALAFISREKARKKNSVEYAAEAPLRHASARDDVDQRDIKAPGVAAKGRNAMPGPTSDAMVDTLKDVDRKTRLSIRALQGVYVLMILFAVGFAILGDDGIVRGALGFFTLAFVLVVITQQLRYRAYSESYLGVPPVEYLRSARKRMRVFTVRTWLAIPTWLFIDVGLCLLVYAASESFAIPVAYVILSLQGLLAIAIALDFLSEYLIWKKSHAPVVAEVDRMLGEIEASLATEA